MQKLTAILALVAAVMIAESTPAQNKNEWFAQEPWEMMPIAINNSYDNIGFNSSIIGLLFRPGTETLGNLYYGSIEEIINQTGGKLEIGYLHITTNTIAGLINPSNTRTNFGGDNVATTTIDTLNLQIGDSIPFAGAGTFGSTDKVNVILNKDPIIQNGVTTVNSVGG